MENWIGQVIRRKGILTTHLEGTVKEERKEDKRRLTMVDSIKRDVKDIRTHKISKERTWNSSGEREQ